MEQELVFKALADEHRRTLLDALFKEDGQTLSELCSYLPMTRYGVMKHLGILEEAGLITSEKVGREKHHYLNAVPLQQVYERWVSKYTRPWAHSLVNLKTHVEGRQMASKHIQQIFNRATPQVVWNALTEAEHTPHYYFGSAVVSDWEVGSEYEYPQPMVTCTLSMPK
ncbi:MAG: helix-turn-helix domain-containing protein, partial [Chloroflexota bacterium]